MRERGAGTEQNDCICEIAKIVSYREIILCTIILYVASSETHIKKNIV